MFYTLHFFFLRLASIFWGAYGGFHDGAFHSFSNENFYSKNFVATEKALGYFGLGDCSPFPGTPLDPGIGIVPAVVHAAGGWEWGLGGT